MGKLNAVSVTRSYYLFSIFCFCSEFQITKPRKCIATLKNTCATGVRHQNIHLKWKDTNVSGERVNRATSLSLWFNINVNWNRFECNEPVLYLYQLDSSSFSIFHNSLLCNRVSNIALWMTNLPTKCS